MPRGRKPKSAGGRKGSNFELESLQAEIEAFRRSKILPIEEWIADLEKHREQLAEEIEKLQQLKSGLSGGGSIAAITAPRRGRPPKNASASAATPAKPAGRKGKRVRRTREDVENHAKEILEFVKSAKNGVTGTQIKDKFGKVIGTVKNYVKQYTGVDLESVGPKTSMRYTVK